MEGGNNSKNNLTVLVKSENFGNVQFLSELLQIGLIYSEETKYTAHAIYDMLAEKEDEIKINVFLQTDGLMNTYSILHSARGKEILLNVQWEKIIFYTDTVCFLEM